MIKSYCFFLIFIFGNLVLNATNTVKLPKEKIEICLENKLTYFHDVDKSENISTIQNKPFVSYKNKNFPELLRQKFWFKIHLNNDETELTEFLFFIRAYSFLKDVKVYEVTENNSALIFHHNTYSNRKIFIPFQLKHNSTYYFEVDFKWTVLFRLKLLSINKNQENLVKESSLQGFYYGFSFLVLLLNLFFFFFTKNRFFIYYIIFQFGILASIAFLDNYIYELFGASLFTYFFEILYGVLISLGSILFINKALELNKKFKYYKPIGLVILGLVSMFFLGQIFQLSFGNINIANNLNLLILLFSFCTAIYYSKQLVYARFIVGGYAILFICHILYILPVLHGYKDYGFYEWHYKIGSVLEMIIFMAAIPYRHKLLVSKNSKLEINYHQLQKEHTQELNLKHTDFNKKMDDFCAKFALKKREQEVLEIIITGASNQDIANKLFISLDTVKYYCSSIYNKTGIKNRNQLTAFFNNF